MLYLSSLYHRLSGSQVASWIPEAGFFQDSSPNGYLYDFQHQLRGCSPEPKQCLAHFREVSDCLQCCKWGGEDPSQDWNPEILLRAENYRSSWQNSSKPEFW